MGISTLPGVRRYALMLLALLAPSLLFAQSSLLRGIVTDENGQPLVGATIIKASTGEGTIAGNGGTFEIQAARGDVLQFSFIGYNDNEVTVGGQSYLEVKLTVSSALLDDVVVVGYGRQRRVDITAAISTVNVEELKTAATTDPMLALQGRVSGVNIQKTSGLAGASTTVKIRGVNTFGSNEPLYIIDGFPGNINSINPNDIESLQILKDGAAAAIYGSEAANGVVIITTKSGTKGKVVIDFNSYIAANPIAKQFNMLDSKGFMSVQNAIYGQSSSKPAFLANDFVVKHDTDWQDEVFRTGFSQSYGLSVSGGTDIMNVAAGYNYANDLGSMIDNRYIRQDAYVKAQLTKNIFVFDARMAYMGSERTTPSYSLLNVYKMPSIVPVYEDDDVIEGRGKDLSDLVRNTPYGLSSDYNLGGINNPIGDYENNTGRSYTQRATAQASLTLNFTDWLSFRAGYSFITNNYKYNGHNNAYVSNATQPVEYPSNSETRNQNISQSITSTLTFDKRWNKHSLNVMLGMQIDMNDYNYIYGGVEGKTVVIDENGNEVTVPAGFADQSFPTLNAGKGGTYSLEGYYNEYNRFGYFGRVNYNFDNRYLLQATVRRDASSYFGSNNRWGTFPSVAVGWRITQEEFFPSTNAVNELKLRGSYGQLGNEAALSPYSYESLMTTSSNYWGSYVQGGNPWLGMYSAYLENNDLKWETTESVNVGIDYAFFDSRLSGSFNWYQTTTKDLLIDKVMPPSAGVNSPIMNVGTMRNRGIEFELRWDESRGEFNYNAGIIVSTTNNKVLKLADPDQTITGVGINLGQSHFPNGTREGGSIGEYYLYETNGIFQNQSQIDNYVAYTYNETTGRVDRTKIQPNAKPGDVIFVDQNGDGVIDADDLKPMGSGIPKAEVSLSLGFGWKGIDFTALIGSAWGNKLYNGNRFFYESMDSIANQFETTENAWSYMNPSSTMPRAIFQDPNQNTSPSDRFLESGDFIRLRQIQIGYTLPVHITKRGSIDKVRFYISGENLLTWTKYSGIDPEFGNRDDGNPTYGILSTGVDRLIYPFTKSYIFGVQVTF